jgi:hypothetical protein
LYLTRGGRSMLDFRSQAAQLSEQTFPFLACGGQLLLEFSGRQANARLESLYQVLPEMLEHGHRNDPRWRNAAVIIVIQFVVVVQGSPWNGVTYRRTKYPCASIIPPNFWQSILISCSFARAFKRKSCRSPMTKEYKYRKKTE